MMDKGKIVRASAVAGMFYEKSSMVLGKNIDDLLKNVKLRNMSGTVRSIIVPHAGYVYSGMTAAHAYKLLEGKKYDCVVIVGPSHREYFDGISVYSGDAYETPLGSVPIHMEIRSALLAEKKDIVASLAGHRAEHSIEVQLPFLQKVLGEFSFVPVIMGDQRKQLCEQLSSALARIIAQRNILLIVSSDLSHFHSYDEAVLLDQRVIQAVKSFDSDAFLVALEEKLFEACGGGPIAVALKTAQMLGAAKVEILQYCNSGDITGEQREVVGYLSAAFLDEKTH